MARWFLGDGGGLNVIAEFGSDAGRRTLLCEDDNAGRWVYKVDSDSAMFELESRQLAWLGRCNTSRVYYPHSHLLSPTAALREYVPGRTFDAIVGPDLNVETRLWATRVLVDAYLRTVMELPAMYADSRTGFAHDQLQLRARRLANVLAIEGVSVPDIQGALSPNSSATWSASAWLLGHRRSVPFGGVLRGHRALQFRRAFPGRPGPTGGAGLRSHSRTSCRIDHGELRAAPCHRQEAG